MTSRPGVKGSRLGITTNSGEARISCLKSMQGSLRVDTSSAGLPEEPASLPEGVRGRPPKCPSSSTGSLSVTRLKSSVCFWTTVAEEIVSGRRVARAESRDPLGGVSLSLLQRGPSPVWGAWVSGWA